jgi:hypothetical protein
VSRAVTSLRARHEREVECGDPVGQQRSTHAEITSISYLGDVNFVLAADDPLQHATHSTIADIGQFAICP